MDEDLLADDGQFKDDGLDEIDLDEEAALLGLSDEEIDNDRNINDDQDVEYFDEDGNLVEIGENNADLYEVADVKKLSSGDDDILDLNLDDELDSFTQEDVERDSSAGETPVKFSEKKQQRGNLISLTSQNEPEKISLKGKEVMPSSNKEIEGSKSTIAYVSRNLTSSRRLVPDANDDFEYDEESEDESMEDDHRERFKSERSNIITLTPAKKRADIPDTLDSVICQEETAKVQAFLENEQRRKMRFKGRPLPRMKSATYSRNPQPFMNQPQNQAPQFPPPEHQMSSAPPTSSQPHKIHLNPHFRGVRAPLPNPGDAHNPCDTAAAPMPMQHYEQPPQNMMPPVYSHQDIQPQMSVAPPVYSSPPTMQYNPPDYPPQPLIQQAPPVWQAPPELPPPVSYSAPPPPVMSYAPQQQNYQNNYNANSFQNTNFQAPPPPVQQIPPNVSYNQPPPPFHMQPPAYTSPPANSAHTNISSNPGYPITQPHQEPYQQLKVSQPVSSHFQRNSFNPNQPAQVQKLQHQNRPLQNLRSMQQNQQIRQSNQFQRRQNQQQMQRFQRQTEKRLLNSNIKEVPMKLARTDSTPAWKSIRTTNSNIKEIPLVDTLSSNTQAFAAKPRPVVDDEDEETKELRLKIEEQKQLREQILKQKEERRRQMAAQRLVELKKRQFGQNKNVISLTQRVETPITVKKQPAEQSKEDYLKEDNRKKRESKEEMNSSSLHLKNALMKMNDLVPGLNYVVECFSGPVFTISVTVRGKKYIGLGRSKKEAKRSAALTALKSIGHKTLPSLSKPIMSMIKKENYDFQPVRWP